MHRRTLLQSTAAATAAAALTGGAGRAAADPRPGSPTPDGYGADIIKTDDGVGLFYRDWGQGRPIVFVAAWALPSEAWQYQMARLSDEGFRCIAFDRRGHGRSSDPGGGYTIDRLADDLAKVFENLDLKDVTLVGHSLGAAEAVRYLSRHGAARVSRLVLIAPTTPFLPRTADNPDGLDPAASQAARAAFARDFPGILVANIKPFVVPATSQAMIDWIVGMMTQTSLQAVIDCNRAFSVADFRQELPKLALPTLIVQGDADASAPLALTGRKTVALIPGAELKVYEGAPHGLIFTHMDRVNADIAAFARG